MESYSRIILAEPDRQVRLTINEFREKEYLHLREYYLDFDEEWRAGREGVAMPLDLSNSRELFAGLIEILSLAESKDILEEFFKDYLDEMYK